MLTTRQLAQPNAVAQSLGPGTMGTGIHGAVTAALLAVALWQPANAEVVRRRVVSTMDDFIFLGKFCFDHTRAWRHLRAGGLQRAPGLTELCASPSRGHRVWHLGPGSGDADAWDEASLLR